MSPQQGPEGGASHGGLSLTVPDPVPHPGSDASGGAGRPPRCRNIMRVTSRWLSSPSPQPDNAPMCLFCKSKRT